MRNRKEAYFFIDKILKDIDDNFKARNKSIPWFEMYGLRNRIVHDYGNVDLSVVHDTLVKDIPQLKKSLNSILP